MFQRLKLQQQIVVGYLLPIVALVLAASWGAWTTQQVSVNFNRVTLLADLTDKTHHIELAYLRMASGTRGYLLEPERQFLDLHASATDFLQDNVAILRGEQLNADNLARQFRNSTALETVTSLRADLTALIGRVETYAASSDRLLERIQQRNGGASSTAIADANVELEDAFNNLNQQLHTLYQDLVLAEQEFIDRSLGFLLRGLLGLAVGVGSVAGLIIWAVATGVARTINRAASSISASALEIISTIGQQEQTANEQASAVSETTTTMEELTVSSQQSAAQAQNAAQAANQALERAASGDRAVAEALNGMDMLKAKVEAIAAQIGQLNQRNEQIGNISQLVTGLANQTNMLALNAAVEAVRAGEYGQGFSVVASEIRKLADESKRSAVQINNLVSEVQAELQATVAAARTGTEMVAKNTTTAQLVSQALAEITATIDNMAASNQQISLNIQQQANAVEQVNQAMAQLNQGAQAAAQGIAQTRQETQELQNASQRLKAIV